MSFPTAAADASVIGPDDPAAGGESFQRADAAVEDTPVPALADDILAVARAAAVEEAGRAELVGDYLGAIREDDVAVAAAFAAADRGYLGWYWSVTLALVEPGRPTISEVVLLPGDQALLAPPWVPWDRRIRAGDVGAGDLLPTAPDDIRLVPGYVDSDDPAVKEVEYEFGFGRPRVLSREGRDDAAQRWHDGPFGPDSAIAQAAPATCLTCGFFTPLAGLLGMALGVCANEYSPADGRVVDGEFGCGAHSQVVIDAPLISASTETVVDELTLEVHLRPGRTATSDAADDVVIAAGGVEAGEEPVANGEAAVAVDEEPVATEEDVIADEVVVAEVIVDEPEAAPVDEQWTPAVDTAPVDTVPVDTAPVDTAPVDSAPVDVAWPAADQPDASH